MLKYKGSTCHKENKITETSLVMNYEKYEGCILLVKL